MTAAKFRAKKCIVFWPNPWLEGHRSENFTLLWTFTSDQHFLGSKHLALRGLAVIDISNTMGVESFLWQMKNYLWIESLTWAKEIDYSALFLWQLVLRIWSLLLLMTTISSVELVDIYGEINAKMVEIPANDAATSTSTSIYLRNGNQKPLLVKSFCIWGPQSQ